MLEGNTLDLVKTLPHHPWEEEVEVGSLVDENPMVGALTWASLVVAEHVVVVGVVIVIGVVIAIGVVIVVD